ncbi:MAG: nicotinate-nucleotide--dimethylbenzimidazole phosphoribosyltransferase [Syntrophorhabdaceae bacterium]|nr:nicotinate-nucleotide--dimethylbenzimidazole phosphoribosyltransferase [Syntrophorhabdaceae bacterium]
MEGIHIEKVDRNLERLASERLDSLTKPRGSLGRLEEFAQRIVAITGEKMPPLFAKKAIFTFAGDHGVVEEGVSLFPKEVTVQMVRNFLDGGAGINVLARHAGAEVVVVDIGVDHDFDDVPGLIRRKVVRGTRNMRKEAAMSRQEASRTIRTGIELARQYADEGYRLFGTGDMGIGNTTPSSAIASVMTGASPADVTGKGTGISDDSLRHKIAVIEDAIAVNKPDPSDPVGVLAKVGGAEIGGIAGLILGAASRRIPVVIDGLISTAGAIIACSIEPAVGDYMFAAHNSVEIGHGIMLRSMGLKPVLDMGLRLGEGTGAALAMSLIEAGLKIYREMATFDEAGVSKELS